MVGSCGPGHTPQTHVIPAHGEPTDENTTIYTLSLESSPSPFQGEIERGSP